MYTVIFPSGKVLTFTVKAVAETYAKAYKGCLIDVNVMKRMSNV